ncbi:MAG: uracil-DNA glycosylase [Pseudomonadales bacterium]|nr:uracil-DNA glycosylase [Pseudomonadales bacterium]
MPKTLLDKNLSVLEHKKHLLLDLYQNVINNYKKFPLAEKPSDIIPGEGFEDAKILFIGEAPGYYETVERRPFVGRSGKFFRQTLVQVGILESEVYITNIVKVRPPENRDPFPVEIEAYKKVLDREIEIVNPKLVVTLGRFGMAKFLFDAKISKVHGRLYKMKWFNNNHLFILPMYHPAAGLRNGTVRQAFINDFKKIPKAIDWIEKQTQFDDIQNSIIEQLF